MEIREFDHVLLKDGRQGDVMDFLGPDTFMVDVQIKPGAWDTIVVKREEITEVLKTA